VMPTPTAGVRASSAVELVTGRKQHFSRTAEVDARTGIVPRSGIG